MRFLYSVIRFVPDPVRGEFINIGIIVGVVTNADDPNMGNIWKFRLTEDWGRAARVDEYSLLPATQEYLKDELPAILTKWNEDGKGDFERLRGDWRNLVQVRALLPSTGASTDEVLDSLMEIFVD